MSSAKALSWGRYPLTSQHILTIRDRQADLPRVDGSMLPFGNGRSYGDSCLNDGGTLLRTCALDHFITFDAVSGVVACESGVLLQAILQLAVPQGWFLPVTPGTQYVTVGGAIANDVHGKNHHSAGTFGCHVLDFELLRSDGKRLVCSMEQNPDLFAATIGGLGLTGLITRARIQLRRIPGPWMQVESHRFRHLDQFFELATEHENSSEYTVAWIDCVAQGRALGRGLLACASHAPALQTDQPRIPSRRRLSMPFTPPVSLVNQLSLRAFNSLHYHRQASPITRGLQHYQPFFYPLDAIGQWNRMYGPRGFLQYQCVVPHESAATTVRDLLNTITAAGEGSFLAVLKRFGNRTSPGLLSFPRAGTTMALDFPYRGERTLTLLERLDAMVDAAGGGIYPAKDARMSSHLFRNYFGAQLDAFVRHIDPHFSSSFWRRVSE